MPEANTSPRGRRSGKLTRRRLLAGAAGAAAAMAAAPSVHGAAPPKYRAAVIGHTGRGNYGHGLDRVWLDIPGVQVVAVADAEAKGLAGAVKRLGGAKGYADYRKMLDEAKPDLVSVAPRWLDQHRDMVVAAAERGVRGIYLEKPMCRTPAEADEMVAACTKNNVKLAIAHQTRYSPKMRVIDDLIAAGRPGRVIEIRARGKDDRRGGGEDLWVLGTHVLDLMHRFGGKPAGCLAWVMDGGKLADAKTIKEGNEGIGPLQGDEVHASYRLAGGAMGTFDSTRNAAGKPSRFGLSIHGTKGVVEIHTGHLPDVHFLPDSSWSPGRTGKKWLPVTSAGLDKPEPLKDGGLHAGNVLAVRDLLAAIEEGREPVANIETARVATEMIAAVFWSHRLGKRVDLPLKHRTNALAKS
jgi:predicted dehydrogenase